MMDVNGIKPSGKSKPGQQMHQDDRVATTGKPDRKAFIRGKTGGEKGADPCRQIS